MPLISYISYATADGYVRVPLDVVPDIVSDAPPAAAAAAAVQRRSWGEWLGSFARLGIAARAP